MSLQHIGIPHLLGGVSQLAPSQQQPGTLTVADNVNIDRSIGLSKRAGTESIAGELDNESLNVTGATNDKFVSWFIRDDDEQFMVLVDPANASNPVEIFSLTGERQTVTYDSDDPRPYITSGSLDPDQRYRLISIADRMLLLNREVETSRAGSDITYSANGDDLRKTTNPNNLPSWSDFPQPPDGVVTPPGSTTSDHLYYAREDDPGLPQGFYEAVSTTQPPWYRRVRTEPANSEVDASTMPVQIIFDGTAFEVRRGDWEPRKAGDDLTNPAVSIFSNDAVNLLYFQNRLWMTAGEKIVGSRIDDFFNLWADTPALFTDSDPIDVSVQERRVGNIDHAISAGNSILLFTRSNRLFAVSAEGAFTPETVSVQSIGSYSSSAYVEPTTLGGAVLFVDEKNFFNTLWMYSIDPETGQPQVRELTSHLASFITATVRQIEASELHQTVYLLSRAETNRIFVMTNGAFSTHTFADDTEILACRAVADHLYMLIRRDGTLWLERMAIGQPEDDTIEVSSGVFQTMGYQVRLDRKQQIQGVYDADENTTSWTLPYEDAESTTIVLGPTWDTDEGGDEQRLAGTILTPTAETVGGVTVLTVDGQYATNISGESAPAYVGRNYSMEAQLPEQFVRDENGIAQYGNTQLLIGRLRHADAGYYRVEIAPENRFTREVEFYHPRIGSTPFDGEYVEESGELSFRIMARSDTVTLKIVNDKPVPCTIIDGLITARFTGGQRSVVRGKGH